MTNEVLLSDRSTVVIRETLIPRLRKNFFRMSAKPWLRYMGLNFDDGGAKMMGNDGGRVQRVETHGVYNNLFKVVHQTTAFGGGVQGADEQEALVNGNYIATRSQANTKTLQGQFTITQQALDTLEGQGGEDAFVDEIAKNSEGAVHRVHKDMNRQMVGEKEGILCYVDGTTSASVTITVKTNPTGTALNEKPATRHIHVNDILWVGTRAQIVANSGYVGPLTVATVASNTTFTVSSATTVTDGTLVVRQAVYSTKYSLFKELTGFQLLINNTGTVQNINKATNAFFASYVANVAGTMATTDIDTMLYNIREYSESPSDIFLIGNAKQWSRYASKLTSTKMITAQNFEGKLAGGLEGLSVYSPDGNIPFYIDNDVSDGYIYAVDPNSFMFGYTKMLNFLDPLRSQTQLQNFYAFYLTGEMAQTNALSCGVLTGITG